MHWLHGAQFSGNSMRGEGGAITEVLPRVPGELIRHVPRCCRRGKVSWRRERGGGIKKFSVPQAGDIKTSPLLPLLLSSVARVSHLFLPIATRALAANAEAKIFSSLAFTWQSRMAAAILNYFETVTIVT